MYLDHLIIDNPGEFDWYNDRNELEMNSEMNLKMNSEVTSEMKSEFRYEFINELEMNSITEMNLKWIQ